MTAFKRSTKYEKIENLNKMFVQLAVETWIKTT